jgi:hypothetical protein
MKEETPWPIEIHNHPFGSRKKKNGNVPSEMETTDTTTSYEGLEPEEVAAKCFENPRLYRDMVLEKVSVEPVENFEGGSTFYMWLNKVCPVGCEFCFFNSPTNCKDQDPA